MSNEKLYTLNIAKSDRKTYTDLSSIKELKDLSNKQLFLLAMAIGFIGGHKISIRGSKESYVRLEVFGEIDKSILNALAIYDTKSLNILSDKKQVYSIVEEFAHSGIEILKNMAFGKDPGSFIKKLESKLRDVLSQKTS